MKYKRTVLFLFLAVVFVLKAENADSTHISFNGQVTGWGIVQLENPFPVQFGGRFVPDFTGNFIFSPTSSVDYEASLNINGTMGMTGLRYDTVIGQMKPYRVWARYSGDNWEVRAGLQKINFGSAKIFRPLMWFDAMDIRDPLQLTDGVYGVVGKYFFPNNANIWLWGLIGNKNPKGYELYGSAQWRPEMGGRFQIPLGPGQMALSTHFRTVSVPDTLNKNNYLLSESRVGLDGKWDIGIGIWFESSITFTDTKHLTLPAVFPVQDLWNVGADYTFGIGNGLGMTMEYFRYHGGNQFLVNGLSVNVLGTMLTYPVSLMDNVSGMIFYLPEQKAWMNYLSWARTYDNLSLYFIGYWNPDNVQLITAQAQNKNLFAGKGLQIMVDYNF